MENHISFNPYNILHLPYIWRLSIQMLNDAYVSAQSIYHPDVIHQETEMSFHISQSYIMLKNYVERGHALIDAKKWNTSLPKADMNYIFNLQEKSNIQIKSEWISYFNILDHSFTNNLINDALSHFANFIYIDKLRINRKIVVPFD